MSTNRKVSSTGITKPKGHPKRGGRKPGATNLTTRAMKEIVEVERAKGELPLQYMLRVMRDDRVPQARRDEMARAAAPFCHPKLQAIAFQEAPAQPDANTPVDQMALARKIALTLYIADKKQDATDVPSVIKTPR